MSFDYHLLGKKLREARESLLIEPEEAAGALEMNLHDYAEVETGHRHLTGDQVVLLADLYRRDFRYFVAGDYPSAESQIQEMFRLNEHISKADRVAIQEFSRLCEYQAFLEELLGNQYGSLPDYGQHDFGHTYYKGQGEEAATWERNRLVLGRQPIPNIFQLLTKQGIRVFKRKLEDRNISGLYLRHPVAGHCILINYLDDIYRQNFSAAHEYCHALFDSRREQQVSYESGMAGQSSASMEWRAGSFAGSFLVPKKRLELDYARPTGESEWLRLIREVAKRFSASSKVVLIRFSEMGWIDDQLRERLFSDPELAIRAHEKYDPEIPSQLSEGSKVRVTRAIDRGLSWHFLKLCEEAYRQEKITYGKVLEMLLLPIEDGIALLNDLSVFMEVDTP